ncbi:M28 family metallopeptidase [Sphingomonas qomolangmaensis]|uniref:M28 family metallopeptidase n=1 Tax=Sphingomonas qomolangmaensis TaxID=2918765 RepID=A0ABY5L464_9SPHN|nr:M28 family metallopeptidase [Sphingomonas qomolangmaensis]UUL81582.1 M28 family metallopeptidase [Sphingomonas qomolangmaensis]
MLRTAALLLALPLSSIAFAQTAPAPASAPAAAAPTESVATINARVNAALPADQAAMKAHVMFLSSDAMQGREAGTESYNVAAQYVASQFYSAGLTPAGTDGSYLQTVPLVSYKPASKGSFRYTPRGGSAAPLVFGEEYLPAPDPSRAKTVVDAPVVFVGYGIDAPRFKRNDYAGVDVKGKIVAFFAGAPASFPGEERAHFGNAANKAVAAQAKGAVGYLTLESPTSAKVRPFSRLAESYDSARMTWARPDGTGFFAAPDAPALGSLSMTGAEKLFAGARTSWASVVKTAETPAARFKAVELPGRLAIELATTIAPVTSYNVAGMLEGSDPQRKNEVVVLTAHLDHVGVGTPKNGDAIYNGAMDNAVGIAAMIEEAKRFKASGTPPKRSILFLAVTAEEKGLVGADYFAHNPSIAKERMVANVNLDMPIITYKFEDVIAFGAERSTLGGYVKAAAAKLGVTFSPDPMPDQGLFTRSDHYRFVQQGIPSVFLWPGTKGPGKAAVDEFFAKHYHQPSDSMGQVPAIDWESGTRFIEANYMIAREIADAPERPEWNKGDFFGTLYEGYGAK